MFYLKRLKWEILMSPRLMGPKWRDKVHKQLIDELEGQPLGKHGFVISIINIDEAEVDAGIVDNDTGAVNITVWYSAIMLRPFKNEILDTIVERTDNHGFFSKIGPLKIFVHKYSMPEDMIYNDDCWISTDETVEIKEGTIVRLRIMGLSVEANVITAIGMINKSFLGQVN